MNALAHDGIHITKDVKKPTAPGPWPSESYEDTTTIQYRQDVKKPTAPGPQPSESYQMQQLCSIDKMQTPCALPPGPEKIEKKHEKCEVMTSIQVVTDMKGIQKSTDRGPQLTNKCKTWAPTLRIMKASCKQLNMHPPPSTTVGPDSRNKNSY